MTTNQELNLGNLEAKKRNPLFFRVLYSDPLLLVLWSKRTE